MEHQQSAAKLTLTLVLLALICSHCSEPDQKGLRVKVLDNLFTDFTPEYNYTNEATVLLGHAARVTIPGYEPWQAYLGVKDSIGSGDINMNSMFRVGSATKMFTATIILQLWEEGLIVLGTPFNVLGLVIETVTGTPYHEELQERICNPLGLGNTHLLDYDISPDDPQIAHGYTMTFDGTHYHGSQAWAAGGLVSTVQDLSIFMQALVNEELFDQQSTFDLMVWLEEGAHYGLGMFVTQTQEGLAYGHSGGIFGYNTRLEYFPEFGTTVISTMSFNGYDFMVTNWYDDFCFPVINEVRRAMNSSD